MYGERWSATIFTVGPSMPDLHGCTKEHLGLALARAFEVPIDTNTAAIAFTRNLLHTSNEAKAARILDLEKGLEASKRVSASFCQERDAAQMRASALETRIAEIEAQLAAPPARTDIDYGQTAYDAHEALPAVKQAHRDRGSKSRPWPDLEHWERNEWRAIGGAVAASLTGPEKPTKPLVCPICHTIGGHSVSILETDPPKYKVKFCNGTTATFDADPRDK